MCKQQNYSQAAKAKPCVCRKSLDSQAQRLVSASSVKWLFFSQKIMPMTFFSIALENSPMSFLNQSKQHEQKPYRVRREPNYEIHDGHKYLHIFDEKLSESCGRVYSEKKPRRGYFFNHSFGVVFRCPQQPNPSKISNIACTFSGGCACCGLFCHSWG